jgi:hypothetical protein
VSFVFVSASGFSANPLRSCQNNIGFADDLHFPFWISAILLHSLLSNCPAEVLLQPLE